ncbi:MULTISPECIES: TolC family protein [unclassified Pseudomonas]|uniref:TolC family protein n=1 Tax=unclassified Pseudomonas TaxID=196821 RepID=UPI000C878806|nr:MULTISPECIES: TolC family protein [unclassified Pseudomonas]PMU08630.1 transporter [Pseudomonas sp. FW305-20]PMU19408.1 transporter [Pseudomonas sp. FW305-122]PMU38523.1 transporter [Pseudomonas sp. FW305-47B]PMX59396.1 transporter [Pseudomonas sp. FW305-33]PMX69402.1 transporter [Pseudomonas sp. FW305-60]
MSYFQRNSTLNEGVAARRPFCIFPTIAFAFLGLFSSKVFAEEGLLQFERVNPGAVNSRQTLAASGSSSERVTQSSANKVPNVSEASGKAVYSVSALEYGRGAVNPSGQVMTHSEEELRGVFLRAVEAAAERSPTVKRALAEQSAAQADIDEAKGQRLPQVDIGTRSKSVEFGSGSGGSSNGQSFSVDVITPLFDWGRIRKTIESRSYLAGAAGSALEAELEASAFDVTSNLVELGKQRIVVTISQKYVDRMAELVKMLRGIVAVDTGRVSELTQARARLLQAEATRSTAESKVRDIEINLRKMIGERPLPPVPGSSYWQLRLPELDWLLAEAVSHPVVKQSEAEAKSADLQAEVVRSASLPQLNWVVGKSTGEDAFGREPAWQTNLSMSWSAFKGGSSRAAERAARQRAEATRQGTEQQLLDLEYRIRTANHDARTLIERAELYRGLSQESNKVREAFYDQWYHLGRRTLLDVLISESDHYNNQVSEVTNRFDGYAAIIRQYASAGAIMRWLSVSER